MEAQEAADFIYESAGTDADIMFGAFDEDNGSDEIKITIIATGFSKISPSEPVQEKKAEPKAAAAPQEQPKNDVPEVKSALDGIVIPEFLLRKKN